MTYPRALAILQRLVACDDAMQQGTHMEHLMPHFEEQKAIIRDVRALLAEPQVYCTCNRHLHYPEEGCQLHGPDAEQDDVILVKPERSFSSRVLERLDRVEKENEVLRTDLKVVLPYAKVGLKYWQEHGEDLFYRLGFPVENVAPLLADVRAIIDREGV